MNNRHPIEGLMQTAMESLKTMVDVNTILGDPVETPDGAVIVPVSRVSFGFAAGGSEFAPASSKGSEASHPFGGGSGAGISLNPVAFLVVGRQSVRLLPVNQSAIYDRLIDAVPQVLDRIQGMVKGERTTDGVVRTTYQV
ncbi:MAG TPA: GerW family sporulation protein [Limnochordia bacterium]|nr:GerW family sporulation protein [Limnochordia bacterium]